MRNAEKFSGAGVDNLPVVKKKNSVESIKGGFEQVINVAEGRNDGEVSATVFRFFGSGLEKVDGDFNRAGERDSAAHGVMSEESESVFEFGITLIVETSSTVLSGSGERNGFNGSGEKNHDVFLSTWY